ncbi:MAG: pyridoxal-phosphate dependent enzyme [Lautropia sp.]
MKVAVQRNPNFLHFECIRCSAKYEFGDHVEGCPKCLAEGYPVNLYGRYGHGDPQAGPARCQLPYVSGISLGEGATPLIRFEPRAGSAVHLKLEGMNPTGSHKDRMAAQLMNRAIESDANEIVAASTGNAGVAIAAYAARAGIRCEIAITGSCNRIFRLAMERCGATLTQFPDSLSRWPYAEQRVKRDGAMSGTNYLLPPVGSPPIGVEGYKAIAHEILEDLGAAPDVVFVPASRGDLLWGIHAGFAELAERGVSEQVPRLIAVEPFPRLALVLEGADYRGSFEGSTRQLSTGGTTVTFQAYEALRRSEGLAIAVPDGEAEDAHAELARGGIYAELSSASVLSAYCRALERGLIRATDVAVLIVTSVGFKDEAV